jgi:glutathione peroxidase-family protein
MGIMMDLFQRNRLYVDNPYNNFFELKAKDLQGEIVPFSKYANKVTLVYNFCPLTDANFLKSEFEKLDSLKSAHKKLEILAFPSCPGKQISDNEMSNLIKANQNISGIKVFNRIYLDSSELSDVYKYCLRNSSLFDLKKGTAQGVPDFSKFLIRKNGKVYEYYTHDMPFDEIDDNIRNLESEKDSHVGIRTDYIRYNKYL